MKFERLVEIAAKLHCFSPAMIAAGESLDQVRVQLSRWARSGKVIRIHKQWHVLSDVYRKIEPSPFVISCTIKPGSYISFQSALSYYGMIPEYVPEITCASAGRPGRMQTPLGRIWYRHMKPAAFWGYKELQIDLQNAYMAEPEKCLLDLFYITPGSADEKYVEELRLQNTEIIRMEVLEKMAHRFGNPRMRKIPELVGKIITEEKEMIRL